jgi:hypothetical protein
MFIRDWVDRRLRPAPVAAGAASEAPPPPMVERVTVEVDVSPATATVALDGRRLDSLSVELVRSNDRHTLRATRDGYAAATLQFVADDSKTVQLKLNRLRRAR